MKRIAIGFFSLLFSLSLISQVPLTQIEGRLEVYLPQDTTSIHIGKGAGVNHAGVFNRSNVFVGSDAGSNTTGTSNSFFGMSSGFSNTSGGSNSFFGRSSGRSNTTGGANSFFGVESGKLNTTGGANNFFGRDSGFTNTTGGFNSFFGAFSGRSNTTGSSSSFFGMSSGFSNTTGVSNSFFGMSSGTFNTTGSKNVYLGDSTAYRVNGDGNVMIGHFAGKYDATASTTVTVNNRLYIHNDATPSPLIYGEFDNRVIHINGEMDIISNSLNLKDLGAGDNHGVIWSEDDNPAFGIIYDGVGNGGDNRLHIRDMISAQEDLVTIKNDGNVGIGIDNPTVTLHIKDIMKLEPISTAPSCLSSNDEGRIYYDSNLKKMRACVGFTGGNVSHGWVNLH